MYFIKTATTKIMALAIMFVTVMTPVAPVEARSATKAEQILFMKEHYAFTKEMGEKYGIPWQAGMATFCGESGYGTNYFARMYHNLSGVGCYDDGQCHEIGRYASDEECIEAYFKLLADNYGLRDQYGDPMAVIAAAAGCGYNSHAPYLNYMRQMLNDVARLESEVVASLEADAEAAAKAEAARKAEMMALLADETIVIVDAKAKSGTLAGATVAMCPALKKTTVGKVAQKIIQGKLGGYEEKKLALGTNYERVQEYVEYITVPM